jgi:ferredoxin-NADP reductase/Na+-transporting NADH:ubiquinone oxidoreductase subunit NqrB
MLGFINNLLDSIAPCWLVPLGLIDSLLNRITMYRLVLYYLCLLFVFAFVFCVLGVLPYNPLFLLFSALVILAACVVIQVAFAKVFNAATNVESVYITALILALIISPVAWNNLTGIGFLVFASVCAIGSKYILAIGKKHIFNPAAFGVAISGFAIGQYASWWVAGNSALLPIVVIGGLCIVRKIRRFDLVFAFSVVALATIVLTRTSGDALTPIFQTFSHSAFFFLAFVMLTEPLTMPPERWSRIVYGSIVGFLFAPHVHFGSLYLSPELALLVGNVFAYIVSPKGRFMLTLKEKNKLGTGVYEFVFAPDRMFRFKPGQYLEWTLPHKKSDARGNRRYFTIASSPTENTVRLGIKMYQPASSYKSALLAMTVGEPLSATSLAGDFTLPKDRNEKLVFIAGGIGVTPFRSMAQYLIDTKDSRRITLFYSNKTSAEIAYKDVFDTAKDIGLKTIYAVTDEKLDENNSSRAYHYGFVDAALIAHEVPDYSDCIFYLSGPRGMVDAFKKTLYEMGISRFRIKSDYFPGFV